MLLLEAAQKQIAEELDELFELSGAEEAKGRGVTVQKGRAAYRSDLTIAKEASNRHLL